MFYLGDCLRGLYSSPAPTSVEEAHQPLLHAEPVAANDFEGSPAFLQWREKIGGWPPYCKMEIGDQFYESRNGYGVVVHPEKKTFTIFHYTPTPNNLVHPFQFQGSFSGDYEEVLEEYQWQNLRNMSFGNSSPQTFIYPNYRSQLRGIKEGWSQGELDSLIEYGGVETLDAILGYSLLEADRLKIEQALRYATEKQKISLYAWRQTLFLDALLVDIGFKPDDEPQAWQLLQTALMKESFNLIPPIIDQFPLLLPRALGLSISKRYFPLALSLLKGSPPPLFVETQRIKKVPLLSFIAENLNRGPSLLGSQPLDICESPEALTLTQRALDAGCRGDVAIRIQEASLPLIDFCFDAALTKGNHTLYQIGIELFQRGIRPSHAIATALTAKFASRPQQFAALRPLTLLSDAQVERLLKEEQEVGADHFCQKLIEGHLLLQKWISQARQNCDWIDFTRFEELRELKKRVKATGAALNEEYTTFIRSYDELIALSPLLTFLQKVSLAVRKQGPLPSGGVKYLSIFAFPYPKTLRETREHLERLQKFDPANGKELLHQARWRVVQGLHPITAVASPSLRFPVSLHGTRLLPSMVKAGALFSKEHLDQAGIATLSGELCGSDLQSPLAYCQNFKSLSFASLDSSLEERRLYYQASTGACLAHTYTHMARGGSHADAHLDLEQEEALLQRDIETIRNNSRVYHSSRTGHAIRRLRAFNKGGDTLARLQEALHRIPSDQASLLKEAFTQEIDPSMYSPDLLSETPLPIIFGSHSRGGEMFSAVDPPFSEKTLLSPVRLQTDLQYAFTSQERLAEAREKLSRFSGIEVFGWDTLFATELRAMLWGEEVEQMFATYPSRQKIVSWLLKKRVLPLYSIPFPETPVFWDEVGNKHPLRTTTYEGYPTHEAYMNAVEQRQIAPRGCHGKTHATLTSILAHLFYTIYQRENIPGIEAFDPTLLSIAAAYHDSARQNGGKDLWDRQSADQFRADFVFLGYPDELLEPYHFALREKDPAGRVFTSLAQEIVNSADTLEILRLIKPEDFRLNLLPAAPHFESPEEARALVREWKAFRDWLKPLVHYLELESENPYEDLMILLSRKGGPMVHKYLDFTEWMEKPVPEMLQKFLDE